MWDKIDSKVLACMEFNWVGSLFTEPSQKKTEQNELFVWGPKIRINCEARYFALIFLYYLGVYFKNNC